MTAIRPAALLVILSAAPASASIITQRLDATLEGGGTISGMFSYDAAAAEDGFVIRDELVDNWVFEFNGVMPLLDSSFSPADSVLFNFTWARDPRDLYFEVVGGAEVDAAIIPFTASGFVALVGPGRVSASGRVASWKITQKATIPEVSSLTICAVLSTAGLMRSKRRRAA